ncbi:MAG TPA: ATP-dependent DNA helicase RecG, partial [Variovorax sp.]|nr:ATP-dependent DNA helicase RecG [Variovorax sp.]
MPAASQPAPSEKSPPAAAKAAPGAGLSAVQRALRKLGLHRDIDFALYLPMRYEDETQIVRLTDVRDGETAQIEAVVTSS